MNQPPIVSERTEALQVQDSAILREIQHLREDMVTGFGGVDKRIDRIEVKFDLVVTRDLFDSTVRRLELQDSNIESNMTNGFNSMREDMNKGFDEVKEVGKVRATKNRWLMGTGLAVAGLLSALVFNTIGLFIK